MRAAITSAIPRYIMLRSPNARIERNPIAAIDHGEVAELDRIGHLKKPIVAFCDLIGVTVLVSCLEMRDHLHDWMHWRLFIEISMGSFQKQRPATL